MCARNAYSKILSQVSLRQPEDGQYGPKHVVVHLAIKYTYVTQLCLTIYNFQGELNSLRHSLVLLVNLNHLAGYVL